MTSRRRTSILLACLVMGLFGMLRSVSADERPNIIFIMDDDMGWADAGCYGSKEIKTPNIDALAAHGMRFTDAYSGCTVCAPARSTLMTGYHMGHTSVRGNSGGIPLRDDDITVAEVLKRAGYVTGGFGKWGLGEIDTEGAAEKQGFDEFFGYYHQIHAHNFFPSYLIKNGKHFPLPNNADLNDVKPKGPTVSPERQFSAHLIFDEMKQFIRANKDQHFFCYAPWTPPHADYHIPEDEPAWQLYKDKPWPNPAKVHAAFISMADRQLGETVTLLKELGIDKKTIVFFCSDNGASHRFDGILDSSGALTGFKRSMNEGGIRVPFIASWPGKIAPGSVSHLPIYFPDFLPTAAQLADATEYLPKDIDGISIVPTLLGKPQDQTERECLYWEWDRGGQAVRRGKWKLLRHKPNKPWELYNLDDDLSEKNDLSKKHPEVLKRLVAVANASHVDARPQIEPKKPEGKRYR
ncbi:Arylsulfatase precursor [Planctomycetes bacterium Pan216]|uniref:Arylsulfatase n=2 Tax=Kolteria novifilia TaxID=2527975 RepID=A0A518B437_9BACT|nr:Arylsulfatase precursor [Planctomycetes bacterium Pan216]